MIATTHPITTDLTIRHAYADDATELRRLAELDSGSAPAGATMVAEVGGRIVAALDLEDGSALADPFVPTAHIVELLRLHAPRAAQEGRFPRPRTWLRAVFGPTLPLDTPAT
jgi:hypothetical protein